MVVMFSSSDRNHHHAIRAKTKWWSTAVDDDRDIDIAPPDATTTAHAHFLHQLPFSLVVHGGYVDTWPVSLSVVQVRWFYL